MNNDKNNLITKSREKVEILSESGNKNIYKKFYGKFQNLLNIINNNKSDYIYINNLIITIQVIDIT